MSPKKEITAINGQPELDRFKKYLIGEKFSESTLYKYPRCVADMLNYFNKNPSEITQDDLDGYKTVLATKYNTNSMIPPIAAINMFFAKILKNTNLKLKAPHKVKVNKVPLTYEEVMKIFDVAKDDPMDYALLVTLYYSQLRAREITKLNLQDVDFKNNKLYIWDAKNKQDDIINIHPFAIRAIKNYLPHRIPPLDGSNALFVSIVQHRIGRGIPWKRVKEYASRAGISKRTYPHLFRISCITHMAENGATALEIQKQSRHRNLETLMDYVQISDKHSKDIYLKTTPAPGSEKLSESVRTISESPVQKQIAPIVETQNNIAQHTPLTLEERKELLLDGFLQGRISEQMYLHILKQLETQKSSANINEMYR